MANKSEAAYIPGVCNINRAEIAHRRKWGIIGLVAYVILGTVVIAMGVNRWARLVVFVPAFIGAIGFLQARNKFCVTYAANGQQNAAENSSKTHDVTDEKARAKDKAKARAMNIQAAAIAAVVAILTVTS